MDSPRMRWALLAVVIAIAFGVTWSAFNPAPHTGGDNAGYVTLAYSLLKNGTYTELFDPAQPPHTKYPPVFPALLAGLMALGARSWASLKAVAVLSTIGAVALTYLWAQRRLGALWGAGVAVALALSSSVVYYSHWILSDPTFLFFTLAALWSLDRADEDDAPSARDAVNHGGRAKAASADAASAPRLGPQWLVVGVAAGGLAYFTRSAGLPLLVALGGWLILRRRWRALGASAVAVGVPALLWMLRARGPGTADYSAEFWLVDPYDPSLGRVGIGGLVGRAVANLQGYVGTHIPGGIVGTQGGGATLLGVALVLAAAVGWFRVVRKRVGPAELFLPLYTGLILLWPQVWSGDRFALPLYPLLFIYAATALKDVMAPRGRGLSTAAGVVALLVLLLPAARSWSATMQDARACAAVVRVQGPFACYGPRIGGFVEAAQWSGVNLPPGSSVLTRKPRIFYVLSGVPSRTFPFDTAAAAHLSLAGSMGPGARYELLDEWDGQAGRYVVGAVGNDPASYCSVRGFGADGGTQLLGILSQEARGQGFVNDDGSIAIGGCPPEYVRGDGSAAYDPSSSRIPLLAGLDP